MLIKDASCNIFMIKLVFARIGGWKYNYSWKNVSNLKHQWGMYKNVTPCILLHHLFSQCDATFYFLFFYINLLKTDILPELYCCYLNSSSVQFSVIVFLFCVYCLSRVYDRWTCILSLRNHNISQTKTTVEMPKNLIAAQHTWSRNNHQLKVICRIYYRFM